MSRGARSCRRDVAVVGAGGAGLYAALSAAARARASCSSARRRSRSTASYWAQGGLAAALAADDSPDLHRQDTEIAGRGLVRPSRGRGARAARRRGSSPTSSASACASTSTATATSRSGSRAATPSAASSTPAAARPGAASCASCRRSSPRTRASRSRAAPARRRCGCATGRCVGLVCEDGRAIAARGVDPRHRRRRGAVVAHDEPARARSASARCSRRRPAPRSPTSSSSSSTRRRSTGVKGREGFLVTEAIRGEGATILDDDGERFVDELAPRDEVARAIDDEMRADRRGARVGSTCATSTPARFPNVVAALREAGLDPTHASSSRSRPPRTT